MTRPSLPATPRLRSAVHLAFAVGLSAALVACGDDGGATGLDAQPKEKDSGGGVTLDSGVGGADTGTGGTDTGTGGTDTGTGNPDGGVVDTGTGNPDTGTTDTGVGQDSGVVDSGPVDTGVIPDGGVPPSDTFVPATRAAEYAAAQCAYVERCQPASFDFTGSNETECTADTTATLTSIYTAYEGSIGMGRMGFDETAFAACIAELGSADCVLGPTPGVCDTATLFQSSQPNGGACVPGECGNGWCQTQSLGQCGTCQPYAQLNQDCSSSVCAPGLDCFDIGQNTPMPVCLNAEVAENQACGTAQTGACRGLLVCTGDPNAGAGTCTRPVGTVGGTCDGAGTDPTDPGCNIFQNLNCTANNQCATVTWNAPNAACDGELQLCNSATQGCDQGTSTCTALPAQGEQCVMGECGPDLYCENPATCQPLKGQGTACAESAECDGSLFCVSGTCQEYSFTSCP